MATRIVTELHDDIDGSDATQTVRSALDGVEYEIDLSDRNANRMRNSFEEFVRHACKVGGTRSRKGTISAVADKSQTGTVREWLWEHGYDVSEAGFQTGCNRSIATVIDIGGLVGSWWQFLADRPVKLSGPPCARKARLWPCSSAPKAEADVPKRRLSSHRLFR